TLSTAKPERTTKSAQALLDSALEFCNASNDFWERGDLENAVDALDQAYSLILMISSDHSPEILQQRDDLRYTISQRIIQVYSSRFTVVNGYHKAIPLDMNPDVQKALLLLKGREKNFFLNAYRRSGRYRPAIVRALKEAGLPEELSWLPLIESGFKVKALSSARALGMWQFIASTGYRYGLKRGQWVDERMDPDKSTEAAIAYLKELHQIFGDWQTVLAAYNCGEGRVLRVINSQKINYLDHFWDLYKRLPSETAFYVPKFLAVLHILNDPEAHGFTLPPVDEEIQTEVVMVDKQASLDSIAQLIGVSGEVLKELNPELKRHISPPRPYDLRVPEGKGPVLLARVDMIPEWRPPAPPATPSGTYVTHRVKKGETLSTIARRYRTSVRAIMAQNRLKSSRYIVAGRTLKIPTRGYASAATSAGSGTASTSASRPSARSSSSIAKYVVKKGDSLWKIANRFNTTTQEIKSLNRLRSNRLSIGQLLLISGHAAETASAAAGTGAYKVMKGDTPHSIAQKHQMELADLLRMNRLTPRSTIFPGQTLLVQVQ
ncbi:MAG TPA: LysM peptidoglycan-binding domain-containing protein, partial [Desulfobacteraceae bacterium]|nr:LysM peptidoglycan-binding domain-containing protein [Desulfobacteraceae bacterium]